MRLKDIYNELEDPAIGFFTDSLTWIEQDGEEILEDHIRRDQLKNVNLCLDALSLISQGHIPMSADKYLELSTDIADRNMQLDLGDTYHKELIRTDNGSVEFTDKGQAIFDEVYLPDAEQYLKTLGIIHADTFFNQFEEDK